MGLIGVAFQASSNCSMKRRPGLKFNVLSHDAGEARGRSDLYEFAVAEFFPTAKRDCLIRDVLEFQELMNFAWDVVIKQPHRMGPPGGWLARRRRLGLCDFVRRHPCG